MPGLILGKCHIADANQHIAEALPVIIAAVLTTISSSASHHSGEGWRLCCYPDDLIVLNGLDQPFRRNHQRRKLTSSFNPRQRARRNMPGLLYRSCTDWERTVPIAENTFRRLVLKSGSTTLTLDKDAGKVSMQRKLLIWSMKPIEAPLSDVSDVTVDTAVDRASGVEVCHTMLIRRTGEAWALPAADKKEAEINASAIRDFLAGQT